MFLLRRKRDGKFWNNSGTRSGDDWVDDIQACTPFRTVTAARMCRAFGYVPSATNWGGQFAAERKRKDKDFEDNYEVIPVTLKLEDKRG